MPSQKETRQKVIIKPIYVDLETAAQIVSISESTLKAMVRIGEFPQPRKTSERRVAWLLREVEEWAESRPVSDLPPPPNTGAKKPRRQD
jgi:prophage regulatory protein